MFIGGLQKFTLIDYPGKIAAVVFTMGCNFRCPYCHNSKVVDPKEIDYENRIKEEDVFEFLSSRKNDLDGVCVTGGEPTLQPGLINFLEKIKESGFLVKVDTNASHPMIVSDLSQKKLVDYWAVDMKTSPLKYKILTKKRDIIRNIKESLELMSKSGAEIELRTTVAPGVVEKSDFENIVEWINKINPRIFPKLYRYSIQNFRPKTTLNKEFMKIKPYSREELEAMANRIKEHCERVVILD